MKRKDNWPRKLNTYLQEVQHNTFEYGVHDCCTFMAGAIIAITGEDIMKEFRGKYHDEATYQEALDTLGQGSVYKTLRQKLGKPVHGAMGQRGDIAFLDGRCGIVIGRQAIFLYKEGLGLIPISQIQRAFKVGQA